MSSATSSPASAPQQAPIPMTPLRNTLQPSSSSSLNSSDPASNPSSSTSLSPPRTPITASPSPCSQQSPSQPPTSVPQQSPIQSQDPFADSSEGATVSVAITNTSAATEPEDNANTPEQTTWWNKIRLALFQGAWLQNTIGMAGLAVALVALFVYAYRGYKMDKYDNLIGFVETCATMKQANISGGAKCDDALSKKLPDRPYSKRDIASILEGFHRGQKPEKSSIKHLFLDIHRLGDHEHSIRNPLCWINSILLIIGMLAFLWIARSLVLIPLRLLARMRCQSRRHGVFQSPAMTEPAVREAQDDHEGTQSHVPIRYTIGDVRQRMKHKLHEKEDSVRSKFSLHGSDASSSVTTLVNSDHIPDGKIHDGNLIELKQTGQKRTFEDPDTGEILHLSPWKSRKQSQEDEDSDESLDEGEIPKRIAQMGVGSAVLGGGTAAEEQLHKKAQAESEKKPQQMGDSLAGLVTNEQLSAKDALLGNHSDD